MPNSVKKGAAAANFEKAMERLEKIVEEMEAGELPLEDLIVRYEEGMNLVKVCQERLAAAEARIEMITRDSAGKTVVKNFEPTVVPENNAPLESAGTPEDVSLF